MNCEHPNCSKERIYLESKCWNHLSEEEKSIYKWKIFEKVKNLEKIEAANFESVDLSETIFPDFAVFNKCNFRKAILDKIHLRKADLKGSDFSGANLKEAILEYADLRGTNTKLRSANIKEANLVGASLQNADLTGADLQDALLMDADFIGAKLKGVHFYASRLSNTRMRKECLANFENVHPSNISIGDEKANWKNCYNTPLLARFVYSSLKVNFYTLGEFDDARWAHIKERTMERKRLFSLGFEHDRCADSIALEHWEEDKKLYESTNVAKRKWLYSFMVWTLTGYGERPSHLLIFSAIIIFIFSLLFHIYGNVSYINSLALSAVSFTTLGFLPQTAELNNDVSLLAGMEALIGSILLALFAAMLGYRAMRS